MTKHHEIPVIGESAYSVAKTAERTLWKNCLPEYTKQEWQKLIARSLLVVVKVA